MANLNEHFQKGVTKMSCLVQAIYIVSFLPQVCLLPFIRSTAPDAIYHVREVTTWIVFTNSWINPLIYTWRNKQFREAFKKILTRKTVVDRGYQYSPTYSWGGLHCLDFPMVHGQFMKGDRILASKIIMGCISLQLT